MKSRLIGTVAVAAGLCLSNAALAQNDLTNPGFEDVNPNFSGLPNAWASIPLLDFRTVWVDAGDAGAQVRTGSKSIMLDAPGAMATFIGWTTNIDDGLGGFFDPPYVHQGGDLYVSGYYNVPDGSELGPIGGDPNDVVAIKLELRRENTSIYHGWEFHFANSTTNGNWERFEMVLTEQMVADIGDFPPYAVSVSVLPMRWDVDGDSQGQIFFDDLCINQGAPACPEDPGCGVADVTTTGAAIGDPGYGVPDGQVTGADIQYFVNFWVAGDVGVADLTTTGAGVGDPGYGVPDGTVTGADIQYYVNLWVLGCP